VPGARPWLEKTEERGKEGKREKEKKRKRETARGARELGR
jgi:hypothetical protein